MNKFDSDRLFVDFTDGTTAIFPINSRRYTLTHSDFTGELYLNIGTDYAWDKVNPLRDEVLGEWTVHGDRFLFLVYLYIDKGEVDPSVSAKRMEVFSRELPLALTAIRYGDNLLFETYPYLNHSPIIVHFLSAYQNFAAQEMWGTFEDFIM